MYQQSGRPGDTREMQITEHFPFPQMFLAALHKVLSHLALSQVADKPRQDIKKQRHPLPRKVHIVKAMAFPVATYGCESWPIKKDEHQRIDAFEL